MQAQTQARGARVCIAVTSAQPRPFPTARIAIACRALRVPALPIAHALMMAARKPIAAPSANRSGHVSPTTAGHVDADLGQLLHMILDGGPTEVGLESTVVDVTGTIVRLLRPGAVTTDEIAAVIGGPVKGVSAAVGAQPTSPGQLVSHYAPRARVRLDAREPRDGEAFIAFGDGPMIGPHVINLSPRGNLLEAAAQLFSALRTLDATGAATIAVMPIPEQGLGLAINDRLRRAAVRSDGR